MRIIMVIKINDCYGEVEIEEFIDFISDILLLELIYGIKVVLVSTEASTSSLTKNKVYTLI